MPVKIFVNATSATDSQSSDIDKLTLDKLKEAMNSVKNRKSPELNSINPQLINYGDILLDIRILIFLDRVGKERKIPGKWRLASVISCIKKRSQDRHK